MARDARRDAEGARKAWGHHGSIRRTRSDRCGDRAARRQRRSALQDRHDLADPASARLRARGRADRSRVDDRDPLSHRGGPDVHRQAPGVHPALRHARRVDPGRRDQPPHAGRRGRIDHARPWYVEGAPELPLGADIANGAAGEPTFYSGRLGIWTARRSRAACSTSGRATARASTTCRCPIRPSCCAAASSAPTPKGATGSARSGRPLPGADRRAGRRHAAQDGAPAEPPGHIHMIVSAPGYETVVTHLFVAARRTSIPTRCSRSRIR